MLITAIVFKGKEQCRVDKGTKFFEIESSITSLSLPVVEEELRI